MQDLKKPQHPQKRLTRLVALSLSSLFALGAGSAQAAGALPVLENPSRGAGTGMIQTLQNYSFDIVVLVGLLLCAVMFLGVCYHAYAVYGEVQGGKKKWGDFGVTVGVGIIILVIGIWLVTKASGIL